MSQVATEVGGSVSLEPAAGGGTLARLRLPWREVGAEAAVDQALASSCTRRRKETGSIAG